MQNVEIINKVAFCFLLIAIPLLPGCEQVTVLPPEPPRPPPKKVQPYEPPPVVSFNFDPNTKLGILSVNVTNRGTDYRQPIIDHISEICSSHNVTLEAGKAPPKGAKYEIHKESLNNGIFTIEFEALY
jgi:hypothetical protein